MRIDKIKIENFRCFKEYEISFASKTSVLIGKNGTGKTNLISAIKNGMSFLSSKYKINGLMNLSDGGRSHVTKFEDRDARYDESVRAFCYPINIEFAATFNNETYNWSFTKNTAAGSLLTAKYLAAYEKFTHHYNTDLIGSELPILAFFSDSYPHKKINVGIYAQSILKKRGSIPRNFGYYEWDSETNCAEIWQNKYIMSYMERYNWEKNIRDYTQQHEKYLALKNKTLSATGRIELDEITNSLKRSIEMLDKSVPKAVEEIRFINSKINLFTKPLIDKLDFINSEFEIVNVDIDAIKSKKEMLIELSFADGRKMDFDTLPQGYKRLLSIVFDISYRSYILNGEKEPRGIVFIDEVELHLHPTLQQEVLERFRKTFPEIQFIATTHSPLVISNLRTKDKYGENKVIKMVHDNGEYSNETVENIYGIDYVTNLIEVMDSKYRPSTIDKLMNAYLVLYGRHKDKEAEIAYEKLKNYLGGNIPKLLQKEIDDQKSTYHRG